jgi:alanine-synthesizing transaminase
MAPKFSRVRNPFYTMADMKPLATVAEHFDVPGNRLYQIRDALLKKQTRIIDLVSGNVTAHGIQFPPTRLRGAILPALHNSKVYRPDPFGLLAARQAISRYYLENGLHIAPEQIILTSGTSISYWYVLKVLANPGDEILVPTPSYPLFDAIADLCGVKLIPYRLQEGARWTIDFAHLESLVNPRTKAVILISPHNPTGAVATMAEVQALSDIAKRHQLAVIADEVFSPFVFTGEPFARPASLVAPLVFTLNGFSKMLALPGLKIGWILVSGQSSGVRRALRALEMISDTFLPVQEIAQAAVPRLLSKSKSFQKSYVLEMNRRRLYAAGLLHINPPEGGFLATLPLRQSVDEEEVACQLLKHYHILVHPGYFYDMEGQHLVFSFASKPAILKRSLKILRAAASPRSG